MRKEDKIKKNAIKNKHDDQIDKHAAIVPDLNNIEEPSPKINNINEDNNGEQEPDGKSNSD